MSSCEKCGREMKNYGLFQGGYRCPNYCIPYVTVAKTPLTLREDQKREAEPAKEETPKYASQSISYGQGCRITRHKDSQGQCEACGIPSATRYTLKVGQNETRICPTCKATLRSGIEKIDHEYDCP